MSEHFDPIDDWLGADVELLPPPPGSFDRIHRRARRRKAVVAMSAAAGAAVVIAAAAVVPQLASSLSPNHGGGTYKIEGSGSPTPPGHTPGPSTTPSSYPTPRRTPGSGVPATANLSITNSNLSPVPGMTPSSVTFVNGVLGAVIGETTYSCPGGQLACEAVAATSDYGRSWTRVDAPRAGPPDGGRGVSQIRFLEQYNGWAFGPELYATHDGGATWTKINGLPGRVIDLATVGGSAFAVVARCTGTGARYAGGCTSFSLYSTAYSSDNWAPVPGATGHDQVQPGGLQLTRQYGYLLAGNALFAGSPSGGAWHQVAIGSGSVPACLSGAGHRAASGERGLIAPGASGLYLICQTQSSGSQGGLEPVLYQSTDQGQTWRRDGTISSHGAATSMAVTSMAVAPASGTIVVATDDTIDYSPDGHTWHRAIPASQAPTFGFSFVGMTTRRNGVAVAADPQSKVIYITTDGGLTWRARPIS